MRAENRKFHVLYRVTCSVTQKYYIGMHSTNDLNDGYKGSGKILWFSRRKHGDSNHRFEIICHLTSRSLLRDAEIAAVLEAKKDPLCMNLRQGGEGSWDWVNEKQLQPKRGHPSFGKVLVALDKGRKNPSRREQNILNLGEGMLGRDHTNEARQKMSQSHLGKRNSQFGKVWVVDQTNVPKKKDRKSARLLVENGIWQYGRKWK